MRILNPLLVLYIGLLCLTPGTQASSKTALEQELDSFISEYAKIRKINPSKSKDKAIRILAERVKWSGTTSNDLFYPIQQDMIAFSSNKKSMRIQSNEYLSWLCGLISYSGNTSYLPVLKAFAQKPFSTKVRRHCLNAIDNIEDYKAWNPAISINLHNVQAENLLRQRLINMLNSDHPKLIRAGASWINHSYLTDEPLLDLSEKTLLLLIPLAASNVEAAEATAWLCKLLGNSGNSKYIASLKKAQTEADQSSVTRWAGIALDKLNKEHNQRNLYNEDYD